MKKLTATDKLTLLLLALLAPAVVLLCWSIVRWITGGSW